MVSFHNLKSVEYPYPRNILLKAVSIVMEHLTTDYLAEGSWLQAYCDGTIFHLGKLSLVREPMMCRLLPGFLIGKAN